MSEKEKDIDTMIEELLKEYSGQNEALEKILGKIIPDQGIEDNDKE